MAISYQCFEWTKRHSIRLGSRNWESRQAGKVYNEMFERELHPIFVEPLHYSILSLQKVPHLLLHLCLGGCYHSILRRPNINRLLQKPLSKLLSNHLCTLKRKIKHWGLSTAYWWLYRNEQTFLHLQLEDCSIKWGASINHLNLYQSVKYYWSATNLKVCLSILWNHFYGLLEWRFY